MIDRKKVIEALQCRDNDLPCFLCAYYRPDAKPVAKCEYHRLLQDVIFLLKEQEKKKIKLIKKHQFTFRRNDIFSMWRVYEKICETLMDEGKLVISRTDDHEKVNFVWEIREDDTD